MFHIIVNPSSSSGRGKSKWDKIEKRFRQCGVPYKVHFSSRSNTIEKICAELTSKGEDCDLVILGGDGTMNAVVNGIRDFEHTRVGFIQTGSGNDLVKGIGISRRRDELVDSILRGRVVRTCDIGRVTYHNQSSLLDPFTHRPLAPSCCRDRLPDGSVSPDPSSVRLFNISAGIGFDAAVCEQVESSRFKNVLNKLHVGKLIYIAVAIRMILRCPMQTFKITLRGRSALPGAADVPSPELVMEKKNTLFAVGMNHRYEGGGFQFCPHARPDDDSVDFCMASPASRLQFFQVFPKAYSGDHVKFDLITQDRAEEITMETELPSWVHTDGEIHFTSTKITLRTLPQKIRFLM